MTEEILSRGNKLRTNINNVKQASQAMFEAANKFENAGIYVTTKHYQLPISVYHKITALLDTYAEELEAEFNRL